MVEAVKKRSRLKMWALLGATVVGLFVITVLTACGWYYNTADVDKIKLQAKELGLATSWEDVGLVKSPTAEIDLWEAVGSTYQGFPSYKQYIDDATKEELKPYAPVPPTWRGYFSHLNKTDIATLHALIEQLPKTPIIFHTEQSFSDSTPEDDWLAEAMEWHRDYILGVPDLELLTEVQNVACIFQALRVNSTQNLYSIETSFQYLNRAFAGRLKDFQSQAESYASELEKLTQFLDTSLHLAWRGDLIQFIEFMEDYDEIHKELSRGSRLESLSMIIQFRYYRSAILDLLLKNTYFPKDSLLSQETLDHYREIEGLHVKHGPYNFDNDNLMSTILYYNLETIQNHFFIYTHLRLMIAELRQQPWPTDPYSDTNLPLHRVEKDGKLIGAYSIGSDGVDNGGDLADDVYFPLYGMP